ncbi:MAG: PQQ-dependent sugar dehydrogenase [Oligoflexia bacterium]|nr:PQQ-dependent sugar dehydrogenase [Oligoflexia bacterium]
MRRVSLISAIALAGVAAVLVSNPKLDSDPESRSAAEAPGVAGARLAEPFARLSFERPVALCSAKDGTGRLFVVEQDGKIQVFRNAPSTASAKIFLDLSGVVLSPASGGGSEEGLLGLAFDPQYRLSGEFYVYYSAARPRRNVLARYRVSEDPDRADATSGTVLLEIEKPYSNHNGGALLFGPDGMLYLSVGDGGGAGDPGNRAQDKKVLLGKILRIDPGSRTPYAVPADNPFVAEGEGARGEIWALGLRNPWRMSFDRETGELWLGDAGQSSWEEIDRVTKGANFGWRLFEGNHPYQNPDGVPADRFTPPFLEYPNDESGGRAVIGGFVYRGKRVESLRGQYVHGDFVSGRIWAVDPADATSVRELATLPGLSAFGEDDDGELYLLSYPDGRVMRLE